MPRRIVLLLSAAVLPAVPLLLWAWVLLRPGPLPDTRIELPGGSSAAAARELTLPNYGDQRAWVTEQARLLSQQPLTVQVGFHVWRASYARLGARFDPGTLLERASALGRSGNPLVALRAAFRALLGKGNRVRWVAHVSEPDKLQRFVDELSARVYRPAVPGTRGEDDSILEGIPSEELNTDLTFAAIERALRRGEDEAHVRTQVVMPPIAERPARETFLDPVASASTLMMERVTLYNPRSRGRARNIELAAHKLNGHLLMPGGRLSFNRVVGRRSLENGFWPAAEVRDGRLVDPREEECPSCVGGGVCQVAGTLHAAAFFAGLDILEHFPHTRLSSFCYLPPGLDTAVAWSPHVGDVAKSKDFIVRNPYPFPIVIDASAEGGELRVRLRGSARPYDVDCCYDVERHPHAQDGEAGAIITRQRTVYKPHARPVERRRIAYPDSGTCMRSPADIVCNQCEPLARGLVF